MPINDYIAMQEFAEQNKEEIPEYLLSIVDSTIYDQGEGSLAPEAAPDPNFDYSQTSLAKALMEIAMFFTPVIGTVRSIHKHGKALVEAFDAFGEPPPPGQTLAERYGALIEESKRSDPNRDVAYGYIGGPNSYSLPGTSFSGEISDRDVLDAEEISQERGEHGVGQQVPKPEPEPAKSTIIGSSRDDDLGYGAAAFGAAHAEGQHGEHGVDAPSAPGHESPGGDYFNTGGRVGALIQHLQTGGEAENADTNMEVANVPMGVVSDADGAPGPFSGGTGVEDDLDMEVEAGSYVLNAEAVQLIGISDINEVIRDAYSIAVALGKEVPTDYDPQNKVPIRISNGEAIIPKALVEIIGLDKLEKWNQKGLQLRKQKEKFMAQQQQQQPPQQQQVASEAPMQQQMGQLMDRGGEVEGDFDIPMSQADAQRKDAEEAWEKFMSTTEPEKPEPSVMNSRAEPLVKTSSSEVEQLSSDDTILGGSGDDILDKKVQPVQVEIPEVLPSVQPKTPTSQQELAEQLREGYRREHENLIATAIKDIQSKKYTEGKPYKRRNISAAIEAVSKVLGGSPKYKERTATFLTEIANAESSFGGNPKTNKKESNILGPWQVGMGDNQAYTEIKRRLEVYEKDRKNKKTNPRFSSLRKNLDSFKVTSWGKNINWENLSRKDMMNPLVNATIARLYISTIDEKDIPATIEGRAKFWAEKYNTLADKKGTAAYYLSKN